MKRSLFIFSLLTSLLIACKKDTGQTNETQCYSNTNARTIVHDGVSREYLLYVPNSYNTANAVPVVFNFHGFGGSASQYMMEADMRSEAESGTFILVYPQGSCLDGSAHWNACPIGDDNKSDADDFGFFTAMIDEISSEYTIDTERIYAVGYSNGGMMAYGLANYQSDLIAGIASVSGAMLDCVGTTNHPMPVLHLHGTSDAVLPYNGNDFWNATQSTLDHWINFNNTAATPTINSDSSAGITIEHYIYGQGNNDVSVEHYKYINGTHEWFDVNYQGKSTSELVWNFFSRFDIHGLR